MVNYPFVTWERVKDYQKATIKYLVNSTCPLGVPEIPFTLFFHWYRPNKSAFFFCYDKNKILKFYLITLFPNTFSNTERTQKFYFHYSKSNSVQ